MTYAFVLRDGEWRAIWRGQVAAHTFSSKGAAEAYLKICNRIGKLRA